MVSKLTSLIAAWRPPYKTILSPVGSGLAFELSSYFKENPQTFWLILPQEAQVEKLKKELQFYLDHLAEVVTFPSLEILPYYGLRPNPKRESKRLKALNFLKQAGQPYIGLTSVAALARRMMPSAVFLSSLRYWGLGEEIDRDDLVQDLSQLGYERVPLVEDPGNFSLRGEIVDLFSPHWESPARMEFFGDLLEKIKSFDPSTQKSLQSLEEILVLPASEVLFNEDKKSQVSLKFREKANEKGLKKEARESFLEALKAGQKVSGIETLLPLFYEKTENFFDYLKKNTPLFCLEPETCVERLKHLLEESQEAWQACESHEKALAPEEIFLSLEELNSQLQSRVALSISFQVETPEAKVFDYQSAKEFFNSLSLSLAEQATGEAFSEEIKELTQKGYRLLVVASSASQVERLKHLTEPHGLKAKALSSLEKFNQNLTPGFYGLQGNLTEGFVKPSQAQIVLTDQEIFGKRQRRARAKAAPLEVFSSFEELETGDYVVHEEHGVARYQGLHSLDFGGLRQDYLMLEFYEEDKLYVPIYRLNQLSRYSSLTSHEPVLDKMGGTRWIKVKAKIKTQVKSMAGELLKLYAQRQSLKGHAYSSGGALYEEFEATFPFEETPDQAKAIKDVEADMSDATPMDRLICGDVGFGKTEVAMRAAYRAVLDGKQVAVLVPTTVLALQHERSFKERFQGFAVNLAGLSRFVSAKQQKERLLALAQGKVDLVIGTHALLGKQVSFKDLGLLIVDEEQRFGVAQKEKIKKLKSNCDVLALSATPIPRSLNMSLSGIRQISLISTPPVDRQAIQTYVAPYSDLLIKEAVLRELKRGGQVYFIHNRIASLARVEDQLKNLLPQAKIKSAHGRMKEKDLEEIMLGFMNQEFNVLLSTSIVESGLDIPLANTMIVNRADRFGLAQLYQLRGRIGRSNRRAYAYLLTPHEERISERGKQRLRALERHSDLGSGFKIAAHDLEIRGAGNLLGAEQSGHIEAVGFEMYTRLLEETVLELKGELISGAPEPELALPWEAYIPEKYLPEMGLRLSFYKRLSMADSEEELSETLEEMEDRFGALPLEIQNLKKTLSLKVFAKALWIRSIKFESRFIKMDFDEQSPVKVDILLERVKKEPGRFQFLSNQELKMGFKEGKEKSALLSLMDFLKSLLK